MEIQSPFEGERGEKSEKFRTKMKLKHLSWDWMFMKGGDRVIQNMHQHCQHCVCHDKDSIESTHKPFIIVCSLFPYMVLCPSFSGFAILSIMMIIITIIIILSIMMMAVNMMSKMFRWIRRSFESCCNSTMEQFRFTLRKYKCTRAWGCFFFFSW